MFGLQGPEAYAYTSLSNCLDVSDIDDIKDYSDTIVSAIFGRSLGVMFMSF
jgi:myosin I